MTTNRAKPAKTVNCFIITTTMMNETAEVLHFIKRFSRNEGTIDTFCFGCCYWFAKILSLRFPDSEIVYADAHNHFGTLINNRVYDITGDITDKYKWDVWKEMPDDSHRRRIITDCINF